MFNPKIVFPAHRGPAASAWLLYAVLITFGLTAGGNALAAPQVVPLELCQELPVSQGEHLVGVLVPDADPTLEVRLFELGLGYEDLAVCKQPWDAVLPQWKPWSDAPGFDARYAWAVFGAAFIVALILSQGLPRAWRRHVTVLGLLGLAGATWVLGVIGLRVVNAAGLPQQLLYGDTVMIERAAGDVEWLPVRGIRDLDHALLARGLRPASLPAGIEVALAAPVAGADPATLGDDPVTTGRQRVEDGVRQVEVTAQPEVVVQADVVVVVVAAVADAEPVAEGVSETPEKPVEVASAPVETVAGQTEAATPAVDAEAEPAQPVEPAPAPQTAWIDADNLVFDFAPAIIDPVGKSYRVRQALNLRASPGTQHERQAVLPRGSLVEVIGPTQGDWWKVRSADGTEGWVSSLWLRLPTE